jgi:hypothetical protein
MATLSDAQLGEMCDWMYGKLGGYGAVIHCTGVGEATLHNAADRVSCLPEITFVQNCVLTVAEFEACIEARVSTQGCASPSPQCDPYFECPLDHDR